MQTDAVHFHGCGNDSNATEGFKDCAREGACDCNAVMKKHFFEAMPSKILKMLMQF